MSRIGLRVTEESADLCARISALSGLFAEGIFSALCDRRRKRPDPRPLPQRDEFVRFMRMLAERGVNIPIKHLNNSAGIINFDRYFDSVPHGNIDLRDVSVGRGAPRHNRREARLELARPHIA